MLCFRRSSVLRPSSHTPLRTLRAVAHGGSLTGNAIFERWLAIDPAMMRGFGRVDGGVTKG
ncbi:hypothetical protein EPI10_032557 [Gossypium australe]|uniref:Uncharacterized protein n=1 Tax=Gossypium australe TaxID=47621 RepID=A0A5B6X6Q4_9ROSI|nr:hypothetical protein EPI10_032557 [Gossypium australe]